VPVLIRQRDHARNHDQPDRAALFDGLFERIAMGLDKITRAIWAVWI
jgi:hypothetical protein